MEILRAVALQILTDIIMFLGFLSITFVLVMITATGNARIEFRHPEFNILTLWWTVIFIFVAFAGEILSQGFLMSVFRAYL